MDYSIKELALGIIVFIISLIVIIEFIISYRAIWIINYISMHGKNYFKGPGYRHVFNNIRFVMRCLLKDRDLYFISDSAKEIGNYEAGFVKCFLLALIYVPLVALSILEYVFRITFTIVASLILSILHITIVIVGNIIFLFTSFKGKD